MSGKPFTYTTEPSLKALILSDKLPRVTIPQDPNHTMRETRSRNGCWTCRLRKRKCDETQPRCESCKSYSLVCHGFGQKPKCIDDGPLQRAEVTAIKIAVSNKVRQRRLSGQIYYSHLASIQPQASLDSNRDIRSNHYPTTIIPSLSPSLVAYETMPGSVYNDYPFSNGMFQYSSTPINGWETPFLSPMSEDLGLKSNNSGSADGLPAIDPINPLKSSHPELGARRSCVMKAQEISFNLTFQRSLLFMYYIEKVFPWQFPFLELQHNTHQKGSLFRLILRSRPLMLSVVTLSGSFMDKGESASSNDRCVKPNQLDRDYQDALREFRLALHSGLKTEREDLGHALTIAGIFVMFTYISVIRGDGSWRLHTSASTHIVPFHLAWNRSYPNKNKDRAVVTRDTTLPHQQHHQSQLVDEQMASTFLVESVIWLQILCSLTGGNNPAPYDEYISFLEDEFSVIQLGNLIGCENWVLACILKIQHLQEWKEQARENNALDVWELTQTASIIRDKLGLSSVFPKLPESFRGTITYVFACAAGIFLEVVVSGDCPRLPKVRQAILEMKTALDAIQKPELLKILAWPLCVAGCMSEPEHHAYFVDLMTSHMNSVQVLKSVLKLLYQSWKMRKEAVNYNPDGICWLEARKELEEDFCLI